MAVLKNSALVSKGGEKILQNNYFITILFELTALTQENFAHITTTDNSTKVIISIAEFGISVKTLFFHDSRQIVVGVLKARDCRAARRLFNRRGYSLLVVVDGGGYTSIGLGNAYHAVVYVIGIYNTPLDALVALRGCLNRANRHKSAISIEKDALYEDFPYLKGVYSIDIYQSDENKSMFVVESDLGNEFLISSEERERLELTLLAIDDVDVEEFVE